MKAVRTAFEILTPISNPVYKIDEKEMLAGVTKTDYYSQPAGDELRRIEIAARTCYKSEGKMTEDYSSALQMVKKIIENGHEAMLEHSSLSVRFICDRAISHELVRHRLAAFAQESQRYCNYSKDQFEGNVTFIMPYWMDADSEDLGYAIWKEACLNAEKAYFDMLEAGYLPQQARSVLPNTVKTEIVVTTNYREWRHILKLRTDKAAHPDMRELMFRLLSELVCKIPIVFDDIYKEVTAK